eukprot:CAMPEP_0183355862 /NCGR_PEP_ID=MMETSP0164_2-20130417/42129_1 /TAXON_ID=221442 /ORGANISM="Coccolithus pelagicus ssp braarudi, Strain PLY182g" /LENGTH=226 /DNA_ID=CAMNT_0025529103 /DNA_START=57 /DNA_END=737 /DNA_ORIENTATION=+
MSSLVLLAFATLQPCNKESIECPRFPCPQPPPYVRERCEWSPNPLVIAADGMCCPEFACGDYSCPTQCNCDSTGNYEQGVFCGATSHSYSSNMSYFDCSQSAASRVCYANIVEDPSAAGCCDCLATTCRTSPSLLLGQPSQCILNCRSPPKYAEQVCPNYSGEQDLCTFYSMWSCVRTEEPSCNKSKLALSACEDACEGQQGDSAADRLDGFLRCLQNCTTAAVVD